MSVLKNIIRKLVPAICLIPLLVGTAGYLVWGERITDALYASFALYFTNPVSDAYNGCIEFTRWTAPMVTATAILCALKNVWDHIRWRLNLLCREDSVAVYSDEDLSITFDKGTQAIYPGDSFQGYARNHIILFSSDQKSLQFYEEHQEQMKKKTVYIGLKELELGLLKEMSHVTLFDVSGSIARLLWKQIALWKSKKENLSVVIYGNSPLAQNILSVGLQLNLFSLEQHITYSMVSDNGYFQIKHHDMELMNSDEIRYYRPDQQQLWDVISDADVVIIADRMPLDFLQTVVVKAGGHSVYYYSPEEGDASEYISFRNLVLFGRNTEVFTDKNIRRQNLIQKAIELNKHYAEKYNAEKEWNNLSGFFKASNISSADYGEVIAVLSQTVSDDVLAQMEHIRWCRFYYLNYWKYGVPENGKNKDTQQRIHKDLVAYDQLTEAEKAKDLEAIKISRNR